MAAGRPCVVTDVGGAREWVVPGETGFLASAPTAASIGTALESLWSARPTWRTMGDRAHEVLAQRRDPSPGATLLEHLARASDRR
jgi:glycosyltransferase involved in cell wall biosynthesis